MTTKPAEKTTNKAIGHSKEQSVGKTKPAKAEAPTTTEPAAPAEARPEEAKAEVKAEVKAPKPSPEVNTAILPPGGFTPKPAEKGKGKQSQKDFVHAHIGPERLKQIQALQDKTNFSRTELIQQAWDNFVSREDVAKYLD